MTAIATALDGERPAGVAPTSLDGAHGAAGGDWGRREAPA